MDLVIAVLELTTVINVRQTDGAAARLTATAEEHRTGRAAVVREELGFYAVPEVDTVTSGNGTPEVEETCVWTRTVEFGAFRGRQHPDADTIPISRSFGSARLIATRLAAVFDVHAEQHGPRSSA